MMDVLVDLCNALMAAPFRPMMAPTHSVGTSSVILCIVDESAAGSAMLVAVAGTEPGPTASWATRRSVSQTTGAHVGGASARHTTHDSADELAACCCRRQRRQKACWLHGAKAGSNQGDKQIPHFVLTLMVQCCRAVQFMAWKQNVSVGPGTWNNKGSRLYMERLHPPRVLLRC